MSQSSRQVVIILSLIASALVPPAHAASAGGVQATSQAAAGRESRQQRPLAAAPTSRQQTSPAAPTAASSRASRQASPASPADWTFLPIDEIGARAFRTAHPEWDGRGVVIGILDTGVDLNVPGLMELPQGGRKILDLRDFSGEGTVRLTKATLDEVDGRPVLKDSKDRKVYGVDRMAVTAPDSVYWMGFLDEKAYRNSSVPDLNNNGRKDDRFAVLAFAPTRDAADSDWVAIVDLDGDGQMDDEKPIRSYTSSGDVVQFRSSTDEEKLHLFTGSLQILPQEHEVEFHIADGSHGTHVAGIASGYRLGGEAGLDGVAPGAQILSLKIGNNTLSGGATTTGSVEKAMNWAADWAKEKGVPIVFNMSYGIGSELEGRSDIDKFIDDFMVRHPDLVYVCSNGNEGPGLSSTGTPAAARFAFAMGNLLSSRAMRDLLGLGARRDHPNFSSSRGAEVPKPDAMAPGTAASTVPPYDPGEIKGGTSMASPQGAGTMALLVSAAQGAGVAWNWATLHQAVKGTAHPLPGYTLLDQGPGVIQVGAAWEALRGLSNRTSSPALGYDVEATDLFFPDGKGPAAFWRNNGWFPRPPESVKVSVKPVFAKESPPDARNQFYRAFTLETDAPWIRLDRSTTYLKGEDATNLSIEYDPALLGEPGLYVGRVTAYARGLSGPHVPEWELWNSVIIPWRFGGGAPEKREWSGAGLEPAGSRRFFIEVPPGTSAMELAVSVPQGQKGQVRLVIHDPAGRSASGFQGWADSEQETRDVHVLQGEDLRPGTWEAIVYANSANHRDSAWRLEAAMSGLRSDPATVSRFAVNSGEKPTAHVNVTNDFAEPFEGAAEGTLTGYRRERSVAVDQDDTWEMPFTFDGDIASATFRISFSDSLYNRLTDCPISVLGPDGTPLLSDAMNQRIISVTFDNPRPAGSDPVTYKLQIRAGFSSEDSKESWRFDLRESYDRRDAERISVRSGQGSTFLLAPGAPVELTLSLSDAPRAAPDGMFNFGEIVFKDKVRSRTRFVLPVRLQ